MKKRTTAVAATKLLALALVAAPLLVACSASVSNTMSADEVKALAAKSTPFQRDILAKGYVTDDDLFKAVSAERQCLIDAVPGIKAEPVTIQSGQPGYTSEYQSTKPPTATGTEMPRDDTVNNALNKCQREYSMDVGRVWAEQKVPSADQREEMRPKLVACLQSAGVEGLKKDSTDKQISDATKMILHQDPADSSGGATPSASSSDSPQVTNINKCLDTYADFFRVSSRQN